MKKVFKFDIHLHTYEGSICGKSKAEDIVNVYKNAGYDGVVITDHFFTGNSRAPKDLPWEERAYLMFEGYRKAKEIGDKIGLKVFGGFEYFDKGSDFLVYGIYEDFIAKHPELPEMKITDALTLFRENGGFVIHAHPLRISKYQRSMGFHLYPDFVDAIEVYNGAQDEKANKFDPRGNVFAKYYADQTDLPQTAASDTHDINLRYGGSMLFERNPEDIFELTDMIRKKEFKISEE